ncbi:MAG: hypothetical protein ACLGH8_18460 [Bacteroidia bacterium]
MRILLFILLFGLLLWGVYLLVLLCNILGIEKERSKNFSNGYRIYLFLYLFLLLLLTLFVAMLLGGALGGKPNYLNQTFAYAYFYLNATSLVFYWYVPLSYKWILRIIGILAIVLPILSSSLFGTAMYIDSDFGFTAITLVGIFAFLSIKLTLYNYKRFIGIK